MAAGQRPGELDADSFVGYGVDSGTAILADMRAATAIGEWTNEQLLPLFPEDPAVPTIVVPDDETGANAFIVQAGYGDGFYPTFVGYTADGRVASFVTDFLVVPRSTELPKRPD